MKPESLKKGDFIVIKFEKKLAHAKVINPPTQPKAGKPRMNVFAQGTLKWIDADQFVRMGEKGASLKAGEFITNKENLKPAKQKETASDIQKEIAELGTGKTVVVMNEKVIPLSGETIRIEKESSVADIVDSDPVIKKLEPGTPVLSNEETSKMVDHGAYPVPSIATLTETDEFYLAPFRKGKTGKSLTVEQVSDAVGKSTPATKHAIERLASMGYLDLMNADLQEYALSIKGLKHVPGTAKPKSEIKKLKIDKTGEAVVSKKERVLALLKNPDLTIKDIHDMTGAAQSYIRGVRERNAKKMDVPKEGTIKRKVYDALRLGGTLVDVAKSCKVTISYAYQIRQQMLSAKII
jgi:hypothetical protein